MKRAAPGASSSATAAGTASLSTPPTLYAACIRRVVLQSSSSPVQQKPKSGHAPSFPSLSWLLSESTSPMTEAMRCDILLELHRQQRFSDLPEYLSRADVLLPVLAIVSRRTQLHAVFQAAVDGGGSGEWPRVGRLNGNENSGNLFLESLVTSVSKKLHGATAMAQAAVQSALNLCSFLIDAGWYEHAERILRVLLQRLGHLRRLRSHSSDADLDAVEREASLMLLHALSCYCKLSEAEAVFHELRQALDGLVEGGAATSFATVRRLPSKGEAHVALCLASFHLEFSCYAFVRSDYRSAYFYAMSAVSHLRDGHPPRLVVDVLRQASKACVVRRKFARAEVLVRDAVLLAREVYGEKHPKYADALIDLGFYLLNVDCISKSMQAYEKALKVRKECFHCVANLRVALAHEDLAYASYVHEYNTGRFEAAKNHAEKALDIWARLLPDNHLLKASSQRVLALILEEIAIDEADKPKSRRLLRKAEELHLSALDLAVRAFGEQNVQTSKHYGNLGRLYQSMEQFDKAEAMHLRAIAIKESLLGNEDYEVALSIGHLASLYNYDLAQFDKAEPLYLRSVLIGLKLFGPTYSGLEYDYRGLIRVYQETHNWTKFVEFSDRWREWKELRDKKEDSLRSGEDVALVEGKTRSVSAVVADLHRLGAFCDHDEAEQQQPPPADLSDL